MSSESAHGQRSLLRHARNYLSGSAIRGVVGFVGVGVLTRLLSPGQYGVVAIYLSVATLFAILLEVNLRSAVARFYLEESDEFPSFLKTCLIFLVIFIALSLMGLWGVKDLGGRFFGVPSLVFFAGVVAAAMQVPWNFQWKLLVAQQQSAAFSRLAVVRDVARLTAAASGAWWLTSDREWGVIGGYVGVSLILGVWLSFRLYQLARSGHFQKRHLRYALAFGVPLIPHALSGHLMNVADRVILSQLAGSTATGHYSFAYDVGAVMSTIVVALNQAWLPIFIKQQSLGAHAKISAMAKTYALYVLLSAIVLITVAREIVLVLASEAYFEALGIVPLIVFSYVFLFFYSLYAVYSFYSKKTAVISVATVCAGVVNVGLNYLFIPEFGNIAAAWTTLASFLLLLVFHYVAARWWLKERVIPFLPFVGPIVLSAVAAAFISWADGQFTSTWLRLLVLKLPVLLACGGFGYYKYRQATLDAR